MEDKQPVLTNKREAFFFVLHYLKAYPTLMNMGLYFGFSEKTASNYIDELKPILKAAFLQAGIEIRRSFADEKTSEELFEAVEEIIIDAFEIPTQRPINEDEQTKMYSGKKNSIH